MVPHTCSPNTEEARGRQAEGQPGPHSNGMFPEDQKESDTTEMCFIYREEALSITFVCKTHFHNILSCDRQKVQNKNVQVTTV